MLFNTRSIMFDVHVSVLVLMEKFAICWQQTILFHNSVQVILHEIL